MQTATDASGITHRVTKLWSARSGDADTVCNLAFAWAYSIHTIKKDGNVIEMAPAGALDVVSCIKCLAKEP